MHFWRRGLLLHFTPTKPRSCSQRVLSLGHGVWKVGVGGGETLLVSAEMLPWHSLWVSVLKTLNCVLLFKIWRFLGLNSNLIWISGKNRCLDYHSPLFRLLISQIKNIVESLCIHAGKQTGPFLAMHLLGKQFPLVLGSFLILLHRPYRPWWLCTLSSHRFQGVGRGSPCGWCLLDWIWGWSDMVSNTKAIKQCRALSGAGIHPCQKHWTTVSDCVTTWISRSHFILKLFPWIEYRALSLTGGSTEYFCIAGFFPSLSSF